MIKTVRVKFGEGELVSRDRQGWPKANGAVFANMRGVRFLLRMLWEYPDESLDYVPCNEYNEKFYAAGKIPGGFLKREGRPKDKEILVSRLIDRPMRPLFDKAFGREIQIVPTVVSSDMVNPPDIISMIASSAAVCISDIPFNGPVAAVRIGCIGGKYIVNPDLPTG